MWVWVGVGVGVGGWLVGWLVGKEMETGRPTSTDNVCIFHQESVLHCVTTGFSPCNWCTPTI